MYRKKRRAERNLSSSESESEIDDDDPCDSNSHPTKQLFRLLSDIVGNTPIKCYVRYLKKQHDVRFDYRTLCHTAERADYIAERMFHGELESSAPRFIDFFSVYDHFKLSNSLFDDSDFYTIHATDGKGRLFSLFDPTSQIRLVTESSLPIKCRVRFLYNLKSRLLSVIQDPESVVYLPYHAECGYSSFKQGGPAGSVGDALAELLDVPSASGLNSVLDIADHRQVFSLLPRYHLMSRVGQTPTSNNTFVKRQGIPATMTCIGFTTIGSGEGESTPIFLSYDLNEKTWRAFFVPDEVGRLAMDSISTIRPSKDVAHAQSVARLIGEEQISEEEEEEEGESCCGICELASTTYSNSTPEFGPQRRFARALDSDDFLTMFGLNNDANRALLKQVFDLSLAAFDCEASTTYLRHDSNARLEPINTGIRSATGQTAIQQAQLIGFGSHFHTDFRYRLFTSKDGHENMMQEFVTHIISQSVAISKEKALLLKPLLDYITKAELAYHAYFKAAHADPQNCQESFNASPWGRFKRHLDRIISCLTIHGMNSEHYDNVLVHKSLAQELRNRRIKLSIVKRQSGIMKMTFCHDDCKIIFSDLSALLSPGVSLASLAKTVKLKDTKFFFPFSSWQNSSFLEQTSLPQDREGWWDALKGAYPPQEVIAAAHAAFKHHNCATVFDYLAVYLRMDVYLLGRASVLLFQEYTTQFGVNPIDCEKRSISSYSANINQKQLMLGRRVACYSPTHSFIYAATRSSCYGGLTCAFQHTAGQTEREQRDGSSKGVAYYDYRRVTKNLVHDPIQ